MARVINASEAIVENYNEGAVSETIETERQRKIVELETRLKTLQEQYIEQIGQLKAYKEIINKILGVRQ